MPHLKRLFRRRLDVEQLEARADVDGLARILREGTYSDKVDAGDALTRLGDAAVPVLVAALEADTIQGDVARVLSRTPRGLAELVARVPRSSPTAEQASWNWRAAFDDVADRSPDLGWVLSGLRHDSDAVRRWANDLVADLDRLDARGALADALDHSSIDVRRYAARALVAVGDERGVEVLIVDLRCGNPIPVRSHAARELERFLGPAQLVDRLRQRQDAEALEAVLCHTIGLTDEEQQALKDPRSEDPHLAAAEALRDLGGPVAVEAFIDVVASAAARYPCGPSEVLDVAIGSLAAAKAPRAAPALASLHEHATDPQLRSAILSALRGIGGVEAAGALSGCLVGGDKWALRGVVTALRDIVESDLPQTPSDSVAALVRILGDPFAFNFVFDVDIELRANQEEWLREAEAEAWAAVIDLLVRAGPAAMEAVSALLDETPPPHPLTIARAREVLDLGAGRSSGAPPTAPGSE